MDFVVVVHLGNHAVAYRDQTFFDAGLQHFRDVPAIDDHMDAKPQEGISDLLQTRITRCPPKICIAHQGQITVETTNNVG